jgi:hypothetical protein
VFDSFKKHFISFYLQLFVPLLDMVHRVDQLLHLHIFFLAVSWRSCENITYLLK